MGGQKSEIYGLEILIIKVIETTFKRLGFRMGAWINALRIIYNGCEKQKTFFNCFPTCSTTRAACLKKDTNPESKTRAACLKEDTNPVSKIMLFCRCNTIMLLILLASDYYEETTNEINLWLRRVYEN